MFRALTRAAAAAFAVVAMLAVSAPALADSTGEKPATADVGIASVGVATRVTIPKASLFQCPADFCNQGVANPTDTVSLICKIPGSTTPWGGTWSLVLNHANYHVGFISDRFLEFPVTSQSCSNVGRGVHVTIPTASLFQCPADFCNQGVANPADDVADICYLSGSTTPWGGVWDLVLNHANNHVGFISNSFLTSPQNPVTCQR
ncbi:MAG TPA: hypothetical protein VGF17_02875 [Phytomonospora sp.]